MPTPETAESADPAAASITQLQARARDRKPFAVALLEQTRRNAQAMADLNALAWTDWDAALVAAQDADRRIAAGQGLGPLTGVPVSIKDLYKVAGTQMQAGTRAPLPAFEQQEAAAVARLRAAGAIVFAKTNMHEIALGATGENEWTGDVKNPTNPAHQSGGSSSGAGAAVARGVGHIGLGSDTGGSIRIPASFCGVVGFKPSFGAVPLAGALHLSWTFDHGGPLTRSVGDARIAYQVLSQRQTDHATVARAPRLAVPAQWLRPRLDDEVAHAFAQTLQSLRAAGAQIMEVETPQLPNAWLAYPAIGRSEAAYVHREALAAGGEGFSAGVLGLLRSGQAVTAMQYHDSMRLRALVHQELNAIARGHDAIVLPTSAIAPPRRGQAEVLVQGAKVAVREMVLGQTLPFNLAQMPTLTVPMAVTTGRQDGTPAGLPLGLQIAGVQDGDAAVLALGEWIEAVLLPQRSKS